MKTKITNNFTSLVASVLMVSTLFSSPAQSAEPVKIEGTVKDATRPEFIPYANVELLRSGDSTLVKATVTNTEGRYVIENMTFGKYLLRISCLGYRKNIIPEFELTARQPSIHFGTTSLTEESKSLDEVTVRAQKLTGRLEDDKLVYSINPKFVGIAQSGLELLRQLPDITVNLMSDEVKLAGSNNILFQVNGRKVDSSYLLQLSPSLIDKIEVSTNPGARYDSDVNAIINVILKKDITYGLNIKMRFQIPVSEAMLSKNNVSFDVYYKKFRFYAGSNFKFGRYDQENINERNSSLPEGTTNTLTQRAKSTIKNNNIGFNYGIDWFPDEKNALSFASSFQPVLPNHTNQTSNNSFGTNQEITQSTGYHSLIDRNLFYDYSLYYKHKFAKKSHEISIENYLSNGDNRHADAYSEYRWPTEELLNQKNQQTGTKNRQFMIRVDYTYPINEQIKLAAGYNGYFNRSRYNYNETITEFSDGLNYDENRQVIYSNLSVNRKNLYLQIGGRYEFSDVKINHQTAVNNRYNLWFPSASVQYKWGDKQTLRLNYRKSVLRPDVSQLSPITYSDDSYSQSVGNTALQHASIHRFEFTHRIQANKMTSFSYIPYLTFIRNDIRQVVISDVDTKILHREFINIGNDLEYGLTFSASLAPFKWWSISPSFTYFRRELQALPEYGVINVSRRTSFRSKLSSQWILPKTWVIFAECVYNAPSINIQTVNHSYYECVIGFNKVVGKKLNVSVFTLNPWAKHLVYDSRTLTMNNQRQFTEESFKYNYLFFIQLGYNFRIGKEGKQISRQREPEEAPNTKKGIF